MKKAIENRKNVHPCGQIIELTERVPWKQHLLDLEVEMNIKDEVKFAIFHENLNDTWRVQGIPIQPDSFICRYLQIFNFISQYIVFFVLDTTWLNKIKVYCFFFYYYSNRVFLHKDWLGVRDEKLSEVSGIPKCVFCHATGFIGGNQTREGALEMALRSLETHEENKS